MGLSSSLKSQTGDSMPVEYFLHEQNLVVFININVAKSHGDLTFFGDGDAEDRQCFYSDHQLREMTRRTLTHLKA